jgi:tetratricopeptide (TPR) repeat protein
LGDATVPLFKTASEVFDQANDYLLRGDFASALNKYNDAIRKFQKSGDQTGILLATAYASVMSLAQNTSNPNAYRAASQALRAVGDQPIKLALRESTGNALAHEADILASAYEWIGLQPSSPAQFQQKAQALRQVATAIRTDIGNNVLVLPELFKQGSFTGEQRAYALAAQSEEALAQSMLATDPKGAAEHYQTARLWWSQAGDAPQADAAASRVAQYGKSAKCWFCGREVSGENVHFVPMPSDLTDLVKAADKDSPLPSFDPATGNVYACTGCHGAVHRLADQLATQRMNELDAKVQPQIQELKDQIRAIKNRINM